MIPNPIRFSGRFLRPCRNKRGGSLCRYIFCKDYKRLDVPVFAGDSGNILPLSGCAARALYSREERMRLHFLVIPLAVLAAGAVVLAGCSPSRHRVGNQALIVGNADRPYAACLRHCRQISRYDVTLAACERACNDARKSFPYRDKGYWSYERCARDMDNLDLNRLDLVAEAQAECERTYEHLHKRHGCKEAFAAYYNAATIETVCGGYTARVVAPQTAQTPLVSAPMTQGADPRVTPLAPAPAYQPAPVYQPAPAPAYQSTPTPAYLPAPAPGRAPAASVRPAPVVGPALSSQPVAAPPKAPAPSLKSPATSAPGRSGQTRPGSPAPVTVKGSPSAHSGKKGTPRAPAPKGAPASSARLAAPASAPAPAQQTVPPSEPAPTPVPVAPQPAPAPAVVPAPQSPSAPATTPAPVPAAGQAAAPAQQTQQTATPAAPQPAPVPAPQSSPVPATTPAPVPVAGQAEAPAQQAVPPSASVPASANTEGGASAQQPSSSSITPPLPSMLKQKESLPATMPPSAQ